MTAAELMFRAVVEGGPYGLAIAGWAAWLYERRANRSAYDQLLQLATAQVETTIKLETSVAANLRLIERMVSK